jgi:hypothetical protein
VTAEIGFNAENPGAGDYRYNRNFAPPLHLVPYSYAAQSPTGPIRTWLVLCESKTTVVSGVPIPNSPTSWFWNVRVGDRLQIGASGPIYTIAGPDLTGRRPNPNLNGLANPERYVNWGPPTGFSSVPSNLDLNGDGFPDQEFLILLNGRDDDGDGYVDEAFDGIDNDGDGLVDPGFNGIDDNGNGIVDEPQEMFIHMVGGSVTYVTGQGLGVLNEFEQESAPFGLPAFQPAVARDSAPTILRRPLPSPKARELSLPTGVLIDMTSASPFDPIDIWERSRLPVDWNTGYVDIMINPNGQITASTYGGQSRGLSADVPFLHFWITDAEDVLEPDYTRMYSSRTPPAPAPPPIQPILPLPEGTRLPNGEVARGEGTLKGHRRLVSVNTRTGQITTSTPTTFDISGLVWTTTTNPPVDTRAIVLGRPYRQAEAGVKEQP